MRKGKKDDFSPAGCQSLTPKGQDQAFLRDRAEQDKREINGKSSDWVLEILNHW